jgi:large subunit ribosomal protein L25
METEIVQGQSRKPGGRNAVKRLRAAGYVPAVVYGHNQPPESIALSAHDLGMALAHHHQIITVKSDAGEESYLIKEVQRDHLQIEPIHVDLMRVNLSEKVTVMIPIEFRGEPVGVQEGGVLHRDMVEVEVECPVSAIPENIEAKIGHLNIGDALLVSDLAFPASVVPTNAEDSVCSVQAPREVVEEEAEEVTTDEALEGSEPEVIGRGKEDEEGEGEES